MEPTSNVFVIYADRDNDLAYDLLDRLKALEKDFNMAIWFDDPIHSGHPWEPQKKALLNQADVVVLLVSNAFMYSEFVNQLEFKTIIDRYKAGKSTVVPILLDHCPWDTDFSSDDYSFSLSELQVLPENKKPIREWSSVEEVLAQVMDSLMKIIDPRAKTDDQAIPAKKEKKIPLTPTPEEQLAINFTEETGSAAIADKAPEEVEVKRETSEEPKPKPGAAAERNVADTNGYTEPPVTSPKADGSAKEENLERETILHDERMVEPIQYGEEQEAQKGPNLKKWLLFGFLTLIIGAAIWFFSNTGKSAKEPNIMSKEVPPVIEDAGDSEQPTTDAVREPASSSKPAIGDSYAGGIVFALDASGKLAKIAHTADAGPMPWNTAMKISEQLGAGWRLPTLEELKIMYNTIGQGASNKGRFADELYWSATPYDANQARLLRFSDGNTTFHYNNRAEYRKFLVRAVRDVAYP